jgi:ribose transport system substrate-binding protein
MGLATIVAVGGASAALAQDIEIPAPGPELCGDQQWEVGFANLVRDITFTIDVEESIQRAADATGCVNVSIFDNELDGATALANADNMITLGVDGVIEFQTDEKFGLVIMDKFRAEAIPVIAIDIPMPGATFFGADNYRAGFMAGEAMGQAFAERFPDSDPLLFLGELPQSGPVPAARITGILEGVRSIFPELDDATQVVRFDSKNTLEESRTQMSNLIQTVPEGTKFMGAAINDGSTIGMQAAIQTAGRAEDAILASQNADSTFREEVCQNPDSIILGSTAYFPEKYGDKLIPTILLLMQGQAVPPSVYVDHVFLTLDNMAEYYPDEDCPAAS